MDTRTEAGEVYILEDNKILVYGTDGIALRLNQRNLDTLRRVKLTLECVKDVDAKDRRFTVAYDSLGRFRFDIQRGEQIRARSQCLLPEPIHS